MTVVRFTSPRQIEGTWVRMVRTGATELARVDGPFEVVMEHGEVVRCDDGWVAVDAAGKLYPITADVVASSYEPAPADGGVQPFLDRVMALDAHPSTTSLLRFFAYDHLPAALQDVSAPFGELALKVAQDGSGPETTVALRKLLEAKDCAVRAALPPAPAYPLVGKD